MRRRLVSRAVLNLVSADTQMNAGFSPAEVLNPSGRNQHTRIGHGSFLGVDQQVPNHPVAVANEKILQAAQRTIKGFDLVAENLLCAAQVVGSLRSSASRLDVLGLGHRKRLGRCRSVKRGQGASTAPSRRPTVSVHHQSFQLIGERLVVTDTFAIFHFFLCQ